ncbi:MAG: hypothetical protein OEV85_02625 [Candidatus Thorarchaeota archaeon]|nr:hypothetical protein [Candidatus Thorarchaeota archaeon]
MKRDFNNTIIEILREAKENGIITGQNGFKRDILEHLGVYGDKDGVIVVDREKRIDLAMAAVEKGMEISEVISFLTWKDFEGLIAGILVENGFRCIESYRRKGNSFERGMEIDVIGVRGRLVFAIDAKMWGVRGGKSSSLRTAVEKQKVRTKKLVNQSDHLSRKMKAEIQGQYEFVPIIVTWLVEEVELHEGVPVVPVFKFNSFVLDFESYRDLIVSYTELIT